jgi:hypothetical protein
MDVSKFMVTLAHFDSPPASIREVPSQHFMWILFVLLIAWAVIAVVLLLAYVPAAHLAWWLSPLIAAHALIGLQIGRAFVKNACLVACCAIERR